MVTGARTRVWAAPSVAIAAALACQGGGAPTAAPAETGPAVADARRAGFGGGSAVVNEATHGGDPGSAELGSPGSDDATPPRPKPEEPDAPDPGKAIAELGAVPAWQTVVDRTHYLARRGQHGVAYGVLGGAVMVPALFAAGSGSAGSGSAGSGGAVAVAPAHPVPAAAGSGSAALVASPYVWLIDDTDGDGALGIRCQFAAGPRPKQGDRVALGGAWSLDDERRWIWQVDAVTPLPPPATPPPPPLQPPGHAIAIVDRLPAGAHTISVAKEGELAYFTFVGAPPAVEGDGWMVADDLGVPVYAIIDLPGDRATYGAQDMRAADERWSLRRGVTYIARLGHIHKHPDKPSTIHIRSGLERLP